MAVACAAGLLCVAGPAAAQTELANECCLILLRPTGARALSLGDAVSAIPAADALFANPALIGPLTDDQFLIHNANTSIEDSNAFTLLLATDVGSFALSYALHDYGETDNTDENGLVVGSSALSEHALLATYGTVLGGGLSAGLSYKLFHYRQDCRGFCGTEAFAATTHMLDAGARWAPPFLEGLQLGAAILNVGFPLQVINDAQASPPPARLRVGAAYEVLQHTHLDSIADFLVSVDIIENIHTPARPLFNIGAEFSIDRTLYVRAGYGSGAEAAGGPGVGIGLRYDRFDLAVAKSFTSSLLEPSDPFQITFAIRF